MRITSLTPSQKDLIDELSSTSGMTQYGNRIRISGMLDGESALFLRATATVQGSTVSACINDILKAYYSPLISAIGDNHRELIGSKLLENLSRMYGGFLSVSEATDNSLFQCFSELPWGGSDPDLCPAILEHPLNYLESVCPPRSLVGYLRSDDGFFVDFNLDEEMYFLLLRNPIDEHIWEIITSNAFKIV